MQVQLFVKRSAVQKRNARDSVRFASAVPVTVKAVVVITLWVVPLTRARVPKRTRDSLSRKNENNNNNRLYERR